ncbi:MAG: (d)CMP kinase [Smithellaceae bacterium]|nr:(d)CMP kinase [Smithellaceae bacterium]
MKPVITIDGPAGAGKSTVSKALAARLKFIYLDTGALYRALAYKALKCRIDVNDPDKLGQLCSNTDVILKNKNRAMSVFVDGEDVGNKIRTEEVGLAASTLSTFPVVREKLLYLQREAGGRGGIVAEGRDMGSVVFPDAEIKIFLDADVGERIRRRHDQLVEKNSSVVLSDISRDMQARDHQDSRRKIAPLVAAPGAIIIDSTSLNVSQVVEKILEHISGVHD